MALSVLRTLMLAIGLVLAYSLAPLNQRPANLLGVKLLLSLVIVAGLLAFHITAVLRSPNPRLRALEAAGLTLPMLLIVFATTYVVLSHAVPSSFNEHLGKTAALYFTVTVFTTVGFGDIVPVTQEARIMVTVQMVADLVLIGVVAKVLLGAVQIRTEGMRSSSTGRDKEPDPSRPDDAGPN